MLQKNLFILFFFALPFGVFAQPESAGRETIFPDTVYKKVLLIPYHPMMHLSDADQDIGEYSEVSGEKVRAAFRLGLASDISDELTKIYPTYTLPTNSTIDNELEIIYSSVNYRMDTVFPVSHPYGSDTLQKKSFFSRIRTSKSKDVHDLKFMNITLSHPALLADLSEKYGTDLFVFLNQFEIITNYDDCLDLALKIYRRQLKLHYSVFDVTGKQVYGDVAVVDFPSNSNDLAEIMQQNFPKIAQSIAQHIPRKKAPVAMSLTEAKESRK